MRKIRHAEHSSCVTVVSNNHADVEELRTKWKRGSAKDRAREIINHRKACTNRDSALSKIVTRK